MGGNRQGGFTLLEMLVVMVIIGLLAGLVGPRLFGKVDSSKVQTAKTQIKMLKSALGILHLDVGVFPPAEQGLKWLTEAPSAEPQRGLWKGPYVDGKLPMDPWGNVYVFRTPGVDGQPFSIISLGSDGREGGEGLAADISD
jgi:general secretion pathway protein G